MVTLLIFLSQLGLTDRGRLRLVGQGGGTRANFPQHEMHLKLDGGVELERLEERVQALY